MPIANRTMRDLGFSSSSSDYHHRQAKTSTARRSTSGGRGDDSPDSVIGTSNISSLFSSASGSAGRCSFGSDPLDHDSLLSHLSKHLAGRDLHESPPSSGGDLDLRGSSSTQAKTKTDSTGKKQEYVQEDGEQEEEEEDTDPAKATFSHALKACHNRRLKSDSIPVKKHDRRRPASLDLNYQLTDAAATSPRFPAMKKSSANSRKSGTFPSPGTPNYRAGGGGGGGGGLQKGWSSERVPLPANSSRRYVNCAPLPFNNGRSLPSKWEDAEKWIFSPVTGDGGSRPSAVPPPHRRPKSKSGPLGAPGYAYYASASPLMMPVFDGGRVSGFMGSSPFSAGVLGVDTVTAGQGLCRTSGVGVHYGGAAEPCMARSTSVHGWSEVATQASLPSSQDEKADESRDAATMISPPVSRRDMATQMSPEGSSNQSSPKEERPHESLSSSSSIPPSAELPGHNFSKLEVRDVQVDDCITLSDWSKMEGSSVVDKGLTSLGEWRKKAVEDRASAWDITDTTKSVSKFRREEAKITAWENLQKAKAEAEIRKLEMKLVKIRTSSMDKIMNKLRSAQRKVQEMRSSVSANEENQVTRARDKILSFRKSGQIRSLSGCFTCHAF